jgi:hypothetical protein
VALVATRVEIQDLQQLPEASELGFGIGNIHIETGYWDHPFLGTKVSLMVWQTRSSTNANGQELSREEDEWTWDQATEFPVFHKKDTYQFAWIPKVNHRASLLKVQTEWTSYYYTTAWVAGNPSFQRVTEGYVVYNLAPTSYQVDAAGVALLNARGQKVPSGPIRKVPGTQRAWSAAITQQGIVEKPDENQAAYWERITLEQEIVTEDMQRVLRWGFTHDYLTGQTRSKGPDETRKDPPSWQIPIKPTAPSLKAHSSGGGVLLDIVGGQAEVEQVWPEPVPLVDGQKVVLVNTAARDFAGAPADPLPPSTSYDEPPEEDPTPEVELSWDQIANVENVEKQEGVPSKAVYLDTEVEPGATYEYYCVALIGQEVGPESNHVTAAVPSGANTSIVGVRVVDKPDGGTEVDVIAPIEPQLDALDDLPMSRCYGETEIFDVPAKLSTRGIAGTWPSGPLTSAEALGQAVATRNFMRETQRLVAQLETVPLLMLERGQLCEVPALTHATRGNALQLQTEVNTRNWRIEGFTLKASRAGSEFDTTCSIFLEEEVD